MRIVIDIEGEDVVVRTERTASRPTAWPSPTPPPEVLRSAAALGATSAGPAPVEAGMPELRREPRSAAVEAFAETVDAGGGPFAPPGMPTEEGEAAVGEINREQS
jgi:hypothetical protein